jgi:hypothetical protein
MGLLLEQKNKFGSTPLFNLPPAPPLTNANAGSSATSRPNKFAGPPPPTSYSCHEVKNGYAIPSVLLAPNNNTTTTSFNTSTPENFYAATDIVLKVMHTTRAKKLVQKSIIELSLSRARRA